MSAYPWKWSVSAGQEPPIEIRLLGPFEVRRGARAIRAGDWPRKKAVALLKRLALERRLLKDQAFEFLWPGYDPASAANNLYKTLHVLRRTLEAALGPGAAAAAFRFEEGVLSLEDSVWVDAREFERLCAARMNPAAGERAAGLARALELYRSELLPDDLYEEWTQLPRERLHRCQREARLALAHLWSEARDFAAAIALLTPLLEQDRADEPAHRALMRLYALSGQRHEALRQYQACVEALAAEIGTPPAAETAALYEQILNQALRPAPTPEVPNAAPELPLEDRPRPVFVGRERELGALHAHLEAVLDGEGRIVFITGEAGQGKTSLMAEFASRSLAHIPELVVAASSCHALLGVSDPYLPFRELVAMLSGDWQRPWPGGEIPAALARRLLALAPQTAQAIAAHARDLPGVLTAAGTQPQRAPQLQDLDQHRVFEQIRGLLQALAARQPLLLLLDDLQWIDTASANLLFYLGRRLAGSPILLAGAYRPSEINLRESGEHPLAPVVQELVRYRGEIRVDLDRSLPEEERTFIDALLDSEPNHLDASFREALYRRTRGHPLFTVELLRALQDQGDLVQDRAGMWSAAAGLDWGILPARVEAVIARRIETLPQELRRLLAVSSVEGESFSAEVLARVQSLDLHSLLQMLAELERRHRLVREQGIWRTDRHAFTRYQFRHNLFRQYLYQQLSPAERRALHGEIAAALEHTGAGDSGPLTVSLAQHHLAAGNAAQAVPYLCRAGDDARRLVALEEAVQFYHSALEHWQGDTPAARAEVLQKLGETYLALGNAVKAIEQFSEAGRLFARAGNRTGMGAVQRLIGRSYYEQGDRAKTLEHYRRALSLLEGEPDNVELARAVSAIAQTHSTANQYDEAIAWGERALTLARAGEIEDVILHALTTIGASLANRGEAERGLAMMAESQERAEALGLPHDAGRAYAGWGDSLVTLERYEAARAVYARMLAYTRKVHAGMFEGVALVQSGYLDWWAGRWKQAWARRQAILKWMANFPGASFVKVWAANLLGWMDNDLGLPEQARANLSDYTAVARSAQEQQTTVPHLAQLARCVPTPHQEAELVQEILALVDAADYHPYEIMPALRIACNWLAQASGGDPAAYARLEKAHAQMRCVQSAASLSEGQAYAAGLRDEWKLAAAGFAEAAEHWEALKRPYDRLRALAGLGKAHVQTGDLRALRSVRQHSARILERLAAELDGAAEQRAFLASPLVRETRSLFEG